LEKFTLNLQVFFRNLYRKHFNLNKIIENAYQGTFEAGIPHGDGKFIYGNGDIYEG